MGGAFDAQRGEVDAVDPVDLAAHPRGEQLVGCCVAVRDQRGRVAHEVRVELCLLDARRPVARAEDGGRAGVSPGEVSCFGQVRG